MFYLVTCENESFLVSRQDSKLNKKDVKKACINHRLLNRGEKCNIELCTDVWLIQRSIIYVV